MFPYFYSMIELKIPNFSLCLFVYFFCMTDEPSYTTSQERMVSELMFLSDSEERHLFFIYSAV